MRSALERYDHEHVFRVRVAQRAMRMTGAHGDPAPLVHPVGQDECTDCVWAPVCIDALPADELSRELRGDLTVREHLALRREGVVTVADLAGTAVEELLAGGYRQETSHLPNAARACARHACGQSSPMRRPAAAQGGRKGAGAVAVGGRRVDLDVEFDPAGRVYLWGVLRSDADGSLYRSFWDDGVDGAASEAALARACMDWLARECVGASVYHYSHVERTQALRILGPATGARLGTAGDPNTWIDMLRLITRSLDSRWGHSLKVVAPHGPGFTWRDDEAGGLQSQEWLRAAREGATSRERAAAARRVLDYNEDDVRATHAVRRWLRQELADAVGARQGAPQL